MFSYNQEAWEYNALAGMLQLVVVVTAVIGSTAFLLLSFFFIWPGRVGLLAGFFVGSVVLMIIGLVEGHASRKEVAAIRAADETTRRLREYERRMLRATTAKKNDG